MAHEMNLLSADEHRRRLLLSLALATTGLAGARPLLARDAQPRALREMQIHRVRELGLEIWVENQPAWRAELKPGARPSFVAETPDAHHPPAVMTYASFPQERVAEGVFATMAKSAITRASQNFGLSIAESRAVATKPASHGILSGHEAVFGGSVQGTAMDVRIFLGQSTGRFPVVMTLYTLRGKMHHLDEHVRRAWGRVAYL